MKFITYQINDKICTGLLSSDEKYVAEINTTLDTNFKDMNDIVSEMSLSELERLKFKLDDWDSVFSIPVQEVKLLSPIPYPKRPLFCLGKNYLDHVTEVQNLPGSHDEIPKFPVFFMKIASPALGHGDVIPNHKDITNMIDYEVELAIIIGKDGINIKREHAHDYIFGYTIANDISARNIQRKHMQWFKGKSLEGFSPLGPCIVHKSAFSLPLKLNLSCRVNDELRQSSNTENMLFGIGEAIEELSKGMYLRKGDIILTGTPAGVGLSFKPFKFLKSGDKVTCEIEGIGILENTIK